MTRTRFAAVCRPLRLGMLALAATGPLAGADAPSPPADEAPATTPPSSAATPTAAAYTIDAPYHELRDGVLYAPAGFVLRQGEVILIGDSLRIDLDSQRLFAAGRVVLARPGLRIAADELGADLDLLRQMDAGTLHGDDQPLLAEAYGVRADLPSATGRLIARAERIEMRPATLRLHNVQLGSGNGSVLGIRCSHVVLGLRAQPQRNREGLASIAEDLTVWQPTLRVIGIPVFWLPALYRDYRLDYPWTRYEFGNSRRLGTFARAWVGVDLPTVFGLHLRALGRLDVHSHNGYGRGAGLRWQHDLLGHGRAFWYGISHEVLRPDDVPVETERSAHALDAEHMMPLPGGALYGRWVRLPGPDNPSLPPDDERFRADFLANDLNGLPWARQSAMAALGNAWGTAEAWTSRQLDETQPGADLATGARLNLSPLQIAGPLRGWASVGTERLAEDSSANQALRSRATARLGATQWFGPLWVGVEAGGDALRYDSGELAGSTVASEQRLVPRAWGELGLRFEGQPTQASTHVLRLSAAVDYAGTASGDDFSPWGFDGDALPLPLGEQGQAGDVLVEDRRHLVLAIDQFLADQGRPWLRLRTEARFALRDDDRTVGSDTASDALLEVRADASAQPNRLVRLDGSVVYDAAADLLLRGDIKLWWAIDERTQLSSTHTWLPATVLSSGGDRWQHNLRVRLDGDRYAWEPWTTLIDGGVTIDRVGLGIERRMVEGRMRLDASLERDEAGDLRDVRFVLSFTLGGASLGPTP